MRRYGKHCAIVLAWCVWWGGGRGPHLSQQLDAEVEEGRDGRVAVERHPWQRALDEPLTPKLLQEFPGMRVWTRSEVDVDILVQGYVMGDADCKV